MQKDEKNKHGEFLKFVERDASNVLSSAFGADACCAVLQRGIALLNHQQISTLIGYRCVLP